MFTHLVGSHGNGSKSPCLVDLLDPRTSEPRQYLVSKNCIQECNAVQKRWSSWFAGDYVIRDGSLYIWTPVHIVFLLYQALEKVREQGNFCSIDHIVEHMDCGNDAYAILNILEAKKETLKHICDWKENGGDCFFKLNDDKFVHWLKSRVDTVAQTLIRQYKSFESMSTEGINLYSIGIVSEYLSAAWSMRLYESFGLEKPSETRTVEVPDLDASILKKNQSKPKIDKKQQQKARAAAVREEEKAKKLKREISGMQKLTSFFGKK